MASAFFFIRLFYSRCLFRFIASLISLWDNSGLSYCHRTRRSVFLSGWWNTMPKRACIHFLFLLQMNHSRHQKQVKKQPYIFSVLVPIVTRYDPTKSIPTLEKGCWRVSNLSWYLTHDRSDGVPGLTCIACSSSPFAWLRFYPVNQITRSYLVAQFFYLSISLALIQRKYSRTLASYSSKACSSLPPTRTTPLLSTNGVKFFRHEDGRICLPTMSLCMSSLNFSFWTVFMRSSRAFCKSPLP
jgi:hypothetical protein